MNDRKQHVMNVAHQLFIEKGFQSTSIQDILEFSGISKGTFYNYFSSKSELLMAIFKSTFEKIEKERNDLLTGADPSDPEIFIKQIELQMKTNRENELIPLFEEVFFSDDKELKQFLEIGQKKTLRWGYERLKEIFDESKHPYLLDAAIMLKGILQQNKRHYMMAHGNNINILTVIRFSVRRVMKMVEEVSQTGEQLLPPEMMDKWLPAPHMEDLDFRKNLYSAISRLKKLSCQQNDYIEKLDFIQEELLGPKNPRKFLIESVLMSMTAIGEKELAEIRKLAESKFIDSH